jgi:hypothetical protein
MKKIEITDEIIRNIISDYNNNHIGSPSLSKKYGINKQKILQILKDYNCNVGSSGRKFTGGKSVSDKRYYEKNKEKIKDYYRGYFEDNKTKISEYHKNWREENKNYQDHIIPISKFNYTTTECQDFLECWSLQNLQPLWKQDNLSKNNRIISHQYKIREQKRLEQQDKIDFDLESLDLTNTDVRQIDRSIAKKVIEEYEWLGYMPRYCNYFFGIYFRVGENEHLGGVVALQPEYGENMGVWDKYGYTRKIIQLSRGVCLWWTPKNTASYMISRVCEWLKKNTHYKVITATVDSNAGEIGTIYQSLNWHYVGTFGGNLTSTGKERIRYGYVINGKTFNQRHIRSKIGTAKKEEVLKHYPDVKIINMGRKKRYFYFLGTKKENKELLKSISNILKPYPKR